METIKMKTNNRFNCRQRRIAGNSNDILRKKAVITALSKNSKFVHILQNYSSFPPTRKLEFYFNFKIIKLCGFLKCENFLLSVLFPVLFFFQSHISRMYCKIRKYVSSNKYRQMLLCSIYTSNKVFLVRVYVRISLLREPRFFSTSLQQISMNSTINTEINTGIT